MTSRLKNTLPPLRRAQRWSTALGLAGLLLLSACGSGSDDEQADSPAGDGRALYEASCATCHGADFQGTSRGPSHLSQVYERSHHDDNSFRSAIANGARAHHWGFGDMPPVPGLTEDQADAVIAYIRQQQDERGLQPYPPE